MLFFGYGAYRSKAKMAQVIGYEPETEVGGIVEGYRLAYQVLSQLPTH